MALHCLNKSLISIAYYCGYNNHFPLPFLLKGHFSHTPFHLPPPPPPKIKKKSIEGKKIYILKIFKTKIMNILKYCQLYNLLYFSNAHNPQLYLLKLISPFLCWVCFEERGRWENTAQFHMLRRASLSVRKYTIQLSTKRAVAAKGCHSSSLNKETNYWGQC